MRDGENMQARTNMILASFMAGAAFSNSSLGIVHSIAETLGGFYRLPHGVTNALMLPHVMRFNRSANVKKFAKIAELMGEDTSKLDIDEASETSVVAVRNLMEDVGMPMTLREVGVLREDFPALVELALQVSKTSGNPREASAQQLRQLYETAY